MGKTSIEWCDFTQNWWLGCTKVGPPCDHCYAEHMMDHRYGRVKWGAGQPRVRTSEQNWRQPFKWDRAAADAGKPATVFCLSLGDFWDNEVDPAWRREAFDVMRRTPNLIYLVLSKRVGNAIKMCSALGYPQRLPQNAALGATMASQDEWDRDLPKLKEAGAVLQAMFTFASVEPMLGPIDARGQFPSWVICGGESGPHARPSHVDWFRSLRDQCAVALTPYLFKQHGEWLDGTQYGPEHRARDANPEQSRFACMNWNGRSFETSGGAWCDDLDEHAVFRVGKVKAGRLLDGIEHNGFPAAIARYKAGATP